MCAFVSEANEAKELMGRKAMPGTFNLLTAHTSFNISQAFPEWLGGKLFHVWLLVVLLRKGALYYTTERTTGSTESARRKYTKRGGGIILSGEKWRANAYTTHMDYGGAGV